MSEEIEHRIKKAIAEFAQRISKKFEGWYEASYEEINENPAETLLSPGDIAYAFEEAANEILDEISTQKEVKKR